ncbi:hypothetical protein TNCV_2337341 [Trichonephila clavipes]|nr:hypothetical protein TNCV_2337341 [Trichonephila clavipes]
MMMLSKRNAVQSHWDSEAWKTKADTGRLSGIKLWDYKRENFENKNKQEVIMEESSKEGTGPRRDVLLGLMMMRISNKGNFGRIYAAVCNKRNIMKESSELNELCSKYQL